MERQFKMSNVKCKMLNVEFSMSNEKWRMLKFFSVFLSGLCVSVLFLTKTIFAHPLVRNNSIFAQTFVL